MRREKYSCVCVWFTQTTIKLNEIFVMISLPGSRYIIGHDLLDNSSMNILFSVLSPHDTTLELLCTVFISRIFGLAIIYL